MSENLQKGLEKLDTQIETENLAGKGFSSDFVLVEKKEQQVEDKIEEIRRNLSEQDQSSEDVLSGVGEPSGEIKINFPLKTGFWEKVKRFGRLGLLASSLFGGSEVLADDKKQTNNILQQPRTQADSVWPGQVREKRVRPFGGRTSVYATDSFATDSYATDSYATDRNNRGRFFNEKKVVSEYLLMSEKDFISFVFFKVLKPNDSPKNYDLQSIIKLCVTIKDGKKPDFPYPKTPLGFWHELSSLDRERETHKHQKDVGSGVYEIFYKTANLK